MSYDDHPLTHACLNGNHAICAYRHCKCECHQEKPAAAPVEPAPAVVRAVFQPPTPVATTRYEPPASPPADEPSEPHDRLLRAYFADARIVAALSEFPAANAMLRLVFNDLDRAQAEVASLRAELALDREWRETASTQLNAALSRATEAEQQRDEARNRLEFIPIDRADMDAISPCGHYMRFRLPCVHEDGAETMSCMQCDCERAQDRAEQAEAALAEARRLIQQVEWAVDGTACPFHGCWKSRGHDPDCPAFGQQATSQETTE